MIPNQFLTDWFVKYILPPIAWDVAMGGVTTEEESISHAQYLDLVYSQYGLLYDIIKDVPHPSLDPSRPTSFGHADGVIGTLETQYKTPTNKISQKYSKIIRSIKHNLLLLVLHHMLTLFNLLSLKKIKTMSLKKRGNPKKSLVKVKRKPLTTII